MLRRIMITLAHAAIGIQHTANVLKPAFLPSGATAKLEVAAQVFSFFASHVEQPNLKPGYREPRLGVPILATLLAFAAALVSTFA